MSRSDPREKYFSDIRNLKIVYFHDFVIFYDLFTQIVCYYGEDDVLKRRGDEFINKFLDNFKTVKGRPELLYILYQIDLLVVNNKKELKIKTKYELKRYSREELFTLFFELKRNITMLLRERQRDIRFIDDNNKL